MQSSSRQGQRLMHTTTERVVQFYRSGATMIDCSALPTAPLPPNELKGLLCTTCACLLLDTVNQLKEYYLAAVTFTLDVFNQPSHVWCLIFDLLVLH